ncbi:hypothetical protein C8J56DRAFT_1162439 [Mycena floridula]|nr:hypothetical protein C8J56DRAFT_1162439 [Mycena floridula]
MVEKEKEKLRVAVIGCGVGGLTLAACISRFADKNIIVDVYEAKPEVSTIGAGIAFWKRSWQVLQDMGFEKEVVERGFSVPKDGESRGPVFRKSDQASDGIDFLDHKMPYGPIGLPRPTLLEILQSKLKGSIQIHTGKRYVAHTISNSSLVELQFKDGSTATADVLIGADGIYSPTRANMFGAMGDGYDHFVSPRFTGTIAYRGTTVTGYRGDRPRIWCGKDKHIVSNLGITCFWSRPELEGTLYDGPVVRDANNEEVLRHFEGWEPELTRLIETMVKPSAWAIHVVNPLPTYVSGPVALLGDAAHGMTPHQGVGGGQALEDAHILGRLLSHPLATKAKIPEILKLYEKIRLGPTQLATEKSRMNGLLYQFNHPDFLFNDSSHPEGPSRDELDALAAAISESFLWLAEGKIEEDWKPLRQR